MKICIIGSSGVPIPPIRGGAVERHIYDLAKSLTKKNCEVHILTLRRKNIAREEIIDNIYFHRGGVFTEVTSSTAASWKHFTFFLYVFVKLLRMNADVFHAHNGISGLAAFWGSRIRGIPFIFTSHTSFTRVQHRVVMENTGLESRFEDLQVSLEQFCAKHADLTIAVSKKVRGGLISAGVSEEKIIVVPNGVDTHRFKQDLEKAAQISKRFHLMKNMVVLYVGRIVKYKGLEYLVDSAPKIIAKHPNVRFVVTGPISYYSSNIPTPYYLGLKKKIESLGLSEHFIFTGAVKDDDLIGLYSACNLLILPSLSEPFGMVLIEAMSCEKPVIGSRIDGIVDIIREGEDGYLVEPARSDEIASKVITLLNHPEIMKKMSQLAREHANTMFDWNILASRIMEIYQRAINGN